MNPSYQREVTMLNLKLSDLPRAKQLPIYIPNRLSYWAVTLLLVSSTIVLFVNHDVERAATMAALSLVWVLLSHSIRVLALQYDTLLMVGDLAALMDKPDKA